MTSDADPTPRLALNLVIAAGTLVLFVTLVLIALAGSGIDMPAQIPIPALGTTVGFALGSLGLLLSGDRRRLPAALCGWTLAAMSAAMLILHLLQNRGWIAPHALPTLFDYVPGVRSLPTSALCLTLTGLAIAIGAHPTTHLWRSAVIAMIGSSVVAFAIMGFILHIFEIAAGWGLNLLHNRVNPLVALGILGLGAGAMAIAAQQTPRQQYPRPLWIPLSVTLGLAAFALLVWRVLTVDEQAHLDQVTLSNAATVRSHIRTRVLAASYAARRMARIREAGGTTRAVWEADAQSLFAEIPGLLTIIRTTPDLAPRWGIPGAAMENPRLTTMHLDRYLRPAMEAARDSRQVVISRAVPLERNRPAILICAPVFTSDGFGGLMIIAIQLQEFLDNILSESAQSSFEVVIWEGNRALYGPAYNDEFAASRASARDIALDISGISWRLQVFADPEHLALARSHLPEVTLVVGLILSALAGMVVFLAQSTLWRAREVHALNQELEHRVQARTAELTRALQDLERSNQDLEQFAYVASHDLQEPLRMVSRYVQLLAKRYRGKLDADADEFIGFAVNGADRMKQQIHDLLAYARLGSQGKPFQQVDTNAVVRAALANLEVAIGDSAATITVDPLPTVRGDHSQLVLVLQNLIANAIKFKGDQPPRIHISATRRDATCELAVQDNGIGIDPEHADRIFVLFRRLHTPKAYPGTGIGLAVCKRIIERHGGRIWFDSQLGHGSTFRFTLTPDDGTLPPPS
jgi:signal transduction histidine kinase